MSARGCGRSRSTLRAGAPTCHRPKGSLLSTTCPGYRPRRPRRDPEDGSLINTLSIYGGTPMRLTSNLAVSAVMAAALGGVARQPGAQSYTVTDLGTLPAFTSSQADGVNPPGQVAGVSADPLRIEHGF